MAYCPAFNCKLHEIVLLVCGRNQADPSYSSALSGHQCSSPDMWQQKKHGLGQVRPKRVAQDQLAIIYDSSCSVALLFCSREPCCSITISVESEMTGANDSVWLGGSTIHWELLRPKLLRYFCWLSVVGRCECQRYLGCDFLLFNPNRPSEKALPG